MNLVLWIAQGVLAVLALLAALLRLRDAVSSMRYTSYATGEPLFTRGTALTTGLLFLAGGVGLVAPALGILRYRWIVPTSAGLLVLVLLWLHVRYRYSGGAAFIAGAALVVLAVLRSLPFTFNQ